MNFATTLTIILTIIWTVSWRAKKSSRLVDVGDLLNEMKTTKPAQGRKTLLHEIIDGLNASDRADLLSAIRDTSVPATVIAKVMAKRGLKLPAATVNRFRRGEADLREFE